jgi:hypothetical protein
MCRGVEGSAKGWFPVVVEINSTDFAVRCMGAIHCGSVVLDRKVQIALDQW